MITSLFKRWIPDLFLIDIRPKLEAQRLGRRLEKYFILKEKKELNWGQWWLIVNSEKLKSLSCHLGLKISDRSDYPPPVAKAYMWLTKTKTAKKLTCGCCCCFQGPPPCWGSSRTRRTFPSRHFSTSVSRGTSPHTANSFVKLGMI